MPIHDWNRISDGTFHHFHANWIVEISRALNSGVLPKDHYAMAEQITGGLGLDVVTLQDVRCDPLANGGGAKLKTQEESRSSRPFPRLG